MPNHAARSTPTDPAAVQATPTLQPIAFRDFDPARVDEEFVRAEAKVQTAVEHYESAKTVSKRVLEARVCV
jgi:hypothetical protein